MNVGELIDQLMQYGPDLEVEVATSPNEDEWYEVYDVEVAPNWRGHMVVVINTD